MGGGGGGGGIGYTERLGEIKRREVSWTLTKKLDTSAGPGEIKRREVVLDSHVRHFCGSRRDQEEGGGAGPTS